MFNCLRGVLCFKKSSLVKHFQNRHGKMFHKQWINIDYIDRIFNGNSTQLVLENGQDLVICPYLSLVLKFPMRNQRNWWCWVWETQRHSITWLLLVTMDWKGTTGSWAKEINSSLTKSWVGILDFTFLYACLGKLPVSKNQFSISPWTVGINAYLLSHYRESK